MVIAGENDRLTREANERVELAYGTAVLIRRALARDKNGRHLAMPKLESLQYKPGERNRRRSQGPQTPEQMLAIIKMINAAYGGNVVNETEH